MKRIALIGSSGSIGRNVLDVVGRHPDDFEIVAMAVHRDTDTLEAQSREHPGALLAVADSAAAGALSGERQLVASGPGSLETLIRESQPDLLVNAVVGFAGLVPTMAALEAGISVAIANKETIVTGGEILLSAAHRAGASLIPIDSEHVAIAQCLAGSEMSHVDRIIMTASGGSLRDLPLEKMSDVSVAEVLRHPTWNMGSKITVDSATLVNKGLEIIEAHWLFGVAFDQIDVVIHPQSIVHSMVRFNDGSIISQMGEPDMRLPILYALSYPERLNSDIKHDVLNFPELTFRAVDEVRYPGFRLARAAADTGGTAPTILNAANEVAVEAFLEGEIGFTRIAEVIERSLEAIATESVTSIDDIVATDQQTRNWISDNMTIGSKPRRGASNG